MIKIFVYTVNVCVFSNEMYKALVRRGKIMITANSFKTCNACNDTARSVRSNIFYRQHSATYKWLYYFYNTLVVLHKIGSKFYSVFF